MAAAPNGTLRSQKFEWISQDSDSCEISPELKRTCIGICMVVEEIQTMSCKPRAVQTAQNGIAAGRYFSMAVVSKVAAKAGATRNARTRGAMN